MRVLLATRSADKAREIRQIPQLAGALELVGLEDLALPPSPEEEFLEGFETFRENALAKARYFSRLASMPVLADDSGIVVDALRGEPGVRSRRFAAYTGVAGAAQDKANNDLLLARLRDVLPEHRTARYVCCAALHALDGGDLVAVGTCAGLIAQEPRGSGGFGYDPLFLQPDLGCTFAELPAAEKHRRSHRARAFRALAAALGPPRTTRVDARARSR